MDQLVNKAGRCFGNSPCATGWPEAKALASKGHKFIDTTGRAAHPSKTAGQNAAAQKTLKLLSDELGDIPRLVGPFLQKRLPVGRDDAVQLRLLRLPAFVGWSKAHPWA